MGGVACNGWRFWTVDGEEPGKAEAAPVRGTRGKRTPAAQKPKTVIQIRKQRKQDSCAEGEVAWFCSACQAGFCKPKGETPEDCPQGHPRETTDDLASAAVESKGEDA